MKILFVCKANVGRSQIAEIIFNNLHKEYSAISAGLNPGDWEGKNISTAKNVVSCLNEVGLTVNNRFSKKITREMVDNVDKIVIMEKENWPNYLNNNSKVEYWDIEDAGAKDLDFHRKVRDQIIIKVKELIEILNN